VVLVSPLSFLISSFATSLFFLFRTQILAPPPPDRYPVPRPPLCLLCDHTCLALWCLYVVSFF